MCCSLDSRLTRRWFRLKHQQRLMLLLVIPGSTVLIISVSTRVWAPRQGRAENTHDGLPFLGTRKNEAGHMILRESYRPHFHAFTWERIFSPGVCLAFSAGSWAASGAHTNTAGFSLWTPRCLYTHFACRQRFYGIFDTTPGHKQSTRYY